MVIYPTHEVLDFRDQKIKEPDMTAGFEVTRWEIADRSAKAELTGQQDITVRKIGIDLPGPDAPPLDLWSRVRIGDQLWDVVTPPSRRNGSRHVRHLTVPVRRRTVKE